MRYHRVMGVPRHDWYLREWLRSLGKTQQWVADQLEIQKSEVSRKATGVTPYNRDDVNQLSALLHLQPFELLMHPEDAMEIRTLRKSIALAAERRSRSVIYDEAPSSIAAEASHKYQSADLENEWNELVAEGRRKGQKQRRS